MKTSFTKPYSSPEPFYYKNQFVPLNENDKDSHTRLLFFDLNDIDEDEED